MYNKFDFIVYRFYFALDGKGQRVEEFMDNREF